ncbi:MAG: amidase [Acidobacteriota bacterium]
MSRFNDVAFLDATAQADHVRTKEVQPIELIEGAISRIQQLNPILNAVVRTLYDQAREAASSNLPDGPFKGVPFLLKDLIATYAGVPLSAGSKSLSGFVPDQDSELVRRLKRAGLVILGKTNTSEFGLLPTTEPLLFGPCHNPWDPSRTPGGSSGGSAAAVAAGLVPMAHGNDGGGSIRIPASCCGLFGFKPTRGRTPVLHDFGEVMSRLIVEHAVTRSVRDSAALLDATSDWSPTGPSSPPPPLRPFAQEVGADPGPLRIAFTTVAATGVPIDPACVRAVKEAALLCADLGHEVEEKTPQINGEAIETAFRVLWAVGSASIIDGIAFLTGRDPEEEQFEPVTWALYRAGRQYAASSYLQALDALREVGRVLDLFFEQYDMLLTPTLAERPVPLGTFDAPAADALKGYYRAAQFVPFTPIFNVSGQPAMSVPLFWTDDGLPVGAHFAGRFGQDATLFRLAAQLEEARPWRDRRPPLVASCSGDDLEKGESG